MIPIISFSIKRTQTYTAHLKRSVTLTFSRTITAMTRETFLSSASMMIIIICIKCTVAFVTMRRFAQDSSLRCETMMVMSIYLHWFIFARTLENSQVKLIQRHHLNLVLKTRCFLKLFQFPYTTRAFFHTCQSIQPHYVIRSVHLSHRVLNNAIRLIRIQSAT